jgi:acyl transferase domain-containing protein
MMQKRSPTPQAIRSTLAALWAEETPSAWDAAVSHDKGRQPLKEIKQAAADFLRESSAFSRAAPDPWLNARLRLKQDAQAKLPLELSSLLG